MDPSLDSAFDALANEHRRAIVHALSLQPRSISELAGQRDLSLQAIHRHISVLEDAGLLVRKKVGRTNIVALQRSPLKLLSDWARQFHPYWGSDSESLENYISHLSKHPTTTEEQ